MPLYHFQIGFPKDIKFRPVMNLVPSRHADNARFDDPRGVINLPKSFLPGIAKVIEIETDPSGNVVKILARQKHDARNDVVYAFLPQTKLIKTAWLQTTTDAHVTLDRSRYDVPRS
jgi:hypothetical protein